MSDKPEVEPVKETVEEPEKVDPAPDPVPPPAPSNDLADIVQGLATRVDGLESVVNAITTTKDSTPGKRPWTHRGFGKRKD